MMIDDNTLYERLGTAPQQLAKFCERSSIIELALFGSIVRDDFRPDSDIDLLVTFATDCPINLLDFVRLEQELEDWLQRSVDLVSKRAIERDRNWLRRREILGTSRVIYESRSVLSA